MAAMPLSPKGVGHFKQILSTIDGMATAICLAFPDKPEIQAWEYFDNMFNCMFKNLLLDWVIDHGQDKDYVSYYEKLKKIRGSIKLFAFHETHTASKEVRLPREMSFLRKPISYLRDKDLITMFRVSLLIQTRSCGTPPPNVFVRSYESFKTTLTAPVTVPRNLHVIAKATKAVYDRIRRNNDLPMEISMALRAKISLSDSAELCTPRHQGGKYEAFRRLYRESLGTTVYKVNLWDGSLTDEVIGEDPTDIGTRVFHYALHGVIIDRWPNLLVVRAEPVTEAGKVRMITVSDIVHSVLLHPISHVLLDVLRLVPSSSAGVAAANHAFEFYKRLNHKNPRGAFVFDDQDLWILSSDLETATDYANPEITKVILSIFCGPSGLGIPAFYLRVVMILLTAPRHVFAQHEDFWTTRGCLMGDPVTKFVMHMMHLVAAEIAARYFD